MSMLRVCSASPSWKTARKSTTTSTDTIAKSAMAAPRSSRGCASAGQPFTDDSALWNMSTSWSLATTHKAVTRPAVIRVMRTQPGTSPRSALRAPARAGAGRRAADARAWCG